MFDCLLDFNEKPHSSADGVQSPSVFSIVSKTYVQLMADMGMVPIINLKSTVFLRVDT